MSDYIPYFRPDISGEEVELVTEVVKSGIISKGPKVLKFKEAISNYIKNDNVVLTNSCTSSLFLALKILGIKEGDEVIVPSFTFCSTINVIEHLGARPVFVDVEYDTFFICKEDIKNKLSDKTKAIIVVHFGGYIVDIEDIRSIANSYKNDISIIEDAAHAFGSTYKGSKIGNHSDAVCFSFYATKNITTGEGGALVLKNKSLTEKASKLSWHGISRDLWNRYSEKSDWQYDVEYPGYKFNMSDLNAAIGLAQIKKVDEMIERRRFIAHMYNQEFQNLQEFIELPILKNNYSESSYHLYVIKIKDGSHIRGKFIDYMRKENIGLSVHFIPNHIQSYYKIKYNCSLPNTEKIYNGIVSLPLYSDLKNEEASYIIEKVKDFFIVNGG